ncbi:hypothetical protein T484DRAFT_1797870 [Baffinella frigidus]|nr:hypothetical protein T484DRAFT_1797870 [Cryptophyta sp. CCMP2293]
MAWEVSVPFSTVGIVGDGGMEYASNAVNHFSFITDGISQVNVGNPGGGTAVLLSFNWASDLVSTATTGLLNMPADEEWCPLPGNSQFGHLLWTVNGRVMYRNCRSSEMSESRLEMVLGGPIHDPMGSRSAFAFEKCNGTLLPECAVYSLGALTSATTLGLFSHIDSDGFLYLGAAGAVDGGLFGCGADNLFAMVRTSIEMGRVVRDDYTPASGRLTWAENDRSEKTIKVLISADGVVDARALESLSVLLSSAQGAVLDTYLSVLLSSAQGAVLDTTRARVEMVIEDAEGPGVVSVRAGGVNASAEASEEAEVNTVLERGACCEGCEDSVPLRMKKWCAYATVSRSGARGAVCASYSAIGNGDSQNTVTAVRSLNPAP